MQMQQTEPTKRLPMLTPRPPEMLQKQHKQRQQQQQQPRSRSSPSPMPSQMPTRNCRRH